MSVARRLKKVLWHKGEGERERMFAVQEPGKNESGCHPVKCLVVTLVSNAINWFLEKEAPSTFSSVSFIKWSKCRDKCNKTGSGWGHGKETIFAGKEKENGRKRNTMKKESEIKSWKPRGFFLFAITSLLPLLFLLLFYSTSVLVFPSILTVVLLIHQRRCLLLTTMMHAPSYIFVQLLTE